MNADLTATPIPIRSHSQPEAHCPKCRQLENDYRNLQRINEQLAALCDQYRRRAESLEAESLPQAA